MTLGSAPEYAEALSVAQAIGKPVFKLNVYKSRDDMLAALASQSKAKTLDAEAAAAPGLTPEQLGKHIGIVCDRSGMSPIVGPRYNVPGANYDLCEAEFDQLPESERVLYVKIAHPGDEPQPCLPGAQPEAGSASKLANGHPMLRHGGGCPMMMMMRRGGGGGRAWRRGGGPSPHGGGGHFNGSGGGGRFHGGRKPAVYQRMLRCGVPLGAVLQKLAQDHGIDPSGGLGAEGDATLASLAASLDQMASQGSQDSDDDQNANGNNNESPLGALLTSFMGPEGVAAAVAAASGVASAASAAAEAANASGAESKTQSSRAEPSAGATAGGEEGGEDDPLSLGSRVMLRNLQQRTDLNGSKGVVTASFLREGRAMRTVQLDFRGRGAGQPEVVNVPAANVLALDTGGREMAKRSAMAALKETGKAVGQAAAAKASAKAEAASNGGCSGQGGAGAAGARGPAAAAAFAQLLEALAGGGGGNHGNQGCNNRGNGGKCGGHNNKGGKKGPAPAVHYSVTCDRSGMSPIVGNRFTVLGANYDLCEAEFDQLPESERVLYVKIEHPGDEPQPCLPKGDAAEQEEQGAAELGAAQTGQAAAASGQMFKKAVLGELAKPKAEVAIEPKPEVATTEPAYGAAAVTEPERASAADEEEEKATTTTTTTTEFATELAELRALGLVGGGPGGAEVALNLLRAHQGRLDSVVNALLDGN